MKSLRKSTLAIAALTIAASVAFATYRHHPAPETPVKHASTIGHGPSIVLLHDSSAGNLDWKQAASLLRDHFKITFLDVSGFSDTAQSARLIHDTLESLNIKYARISGAQTGETLARQYALTYPDSSESFLLPQNGDDLELLAQLLTSTNILSCQDKDLAAM